MPRRIDGEIVTGPAVAPRTYEIFLEGERALARGNLEAARRAFAAASPESDPVVLGRLAEVSARLGDASGAKRMLDEGDRRFPDSEAISMARARVAETSGDVEAAIAAYRRASELAPSSPDPVLAAATLFERASRLEDAVEVLARFVADAPDRSAAAWWRYLVLLVETGGSAPAIEAAAETLHRFAPSFDERMRELAGRAIESDRPEVALGVLRPLPRSATDAHPYLLALAAVEGSEPALTVLDRLSDPMVGGPLGRGRLLLELGRPAMAAALAEAIVDAQPEPSAYLLLGRAERARGRIPPALAALRRIPESAAEYVPAQIETARALADSGQGARARSLLAGLVPTYGEAWPEIAAALEVVSAANAAD